MSNNEVKHDGIVQGIEGDKVLVSIIAKAACLSCQVKSACNVSDLSEKIIEVNRFDIDYKVGENVTVALKETTGFKALFLGYIMPFLVLISTFVLLSLFTKSELIIGLGALLSLIPYYLMLFLLRDQIKKQFSFFVHKR
ncbi:MAG: SoxR reducing system RseC family protein [Bacteroidales bacterium]|nr:SoxR reducing system RseC family protein [Bacteroidales bacterium]